MRILFDAFWWLNGPPSGQRVVKNIIASWVRAYPDDTVAIATPDTTDPGFQADLSTYFAEGSAPELIRLRIPQHGASMLLEMPLHARLSKFDVVFAHNFTPPASTSLRCTFLHDVLFQEYPDWFTRAERIYFAPMTPSGRNADIIFTSTQAEARRIARHNPQLAGKIEAVGLALPEEFDAAVPAVFADVTPFSFLLTVGRLNVRKNVVRLAAALVRKDLVSPDNPLVVVGSPDGAPPDLGPIQDAIRDGSIVFTGHISDAELKWLYQHCSLFAFPSLDEGFGIPLLEATHCGAPSAVSDIPAFREIARPETVFFDPKNEADIATVIAAAPRRTGPEAAPAQQFSWPTVVAAMRRRIIQQQEGVAATAITSG